MDDWSPINHIPARHYDSRVYSSTYVGVYKIILEQAYTAFILYMYCDYTHYCIHIDCEVVTFSLFCSQTKKLLWCKHASKVEGYAWKKTVKTWSDDILLGWIRICVQRAERWRRLLLEFVLHLFLVFIRMTWRMTNISV